MCDTRIANSRLEVQQLIDWAALEGWNPGLDDAALFYATDPTGFFVSTCTTRTATKETISANHHHHHHRSSSSNDNDNDGTAAVTRVVAGLSLVKHSPTFAFLGLYLCDKEYRGQGIGLATWKAALQTLDHNNNNNTNSKAATGVVDNTNNTASCTLIGLDGVVEQQKNYRKSGFVYHFGNRRYTCVLSQRDYGVTKGELQVDESSGKDAIAVQIKDASMEDLDLIVAYDAAIGGVERPTFWRAWLTTMSAAAAAADDDDDNNSRKSRMSLLIATATATTAAAIQNNPKVTVVGLVGVRQCWVGYKIGPLLADSKTTALRLLRRVATRVTSSIGSTTTTSTSKQQISQSQPPSGSGSDESTSATVEVSIDVPDTNKVALSIFENNMRVGSGNEEDHEAPLDEFIGIRSIQWTMTFETARMYRGASAPKMDMDRLFGVATLELG